MEEKKKKIKKSTTKKNDLQLTEKKDLVENSKNENNKQNNLISFIELIGIIAFIIIVLVFFQGSVIWNIVVLLLILTVLVFVHEGGHFLAAKKNGVYVYEFALGMGPKVLGFKRKNDPTEYTIRLLPIGGYCQMAGEEGEDDDNLPKNQFMCNKPKIQKAIILVAGVCMNFITAIIILFFISLVWGSTEQSSIIGSVESGSAAEEAGLVVGDKIVKYNGKSVSTWDKISLLAALKSNAKLDTYTYVIEHEDGTKETYKIKPKEYVYVNDGADIIEVTEDHSLKDIIKEYNLAKDTTSTKLVGIGYSTERKHGFVNAIKYAFVKFSGLVSMMLLIVWSLITGKLGFNSLSGPVGMYSLVNQVASYGIANILYLAAYLSINLGVINILPFPAFDGGRLLFVVIEAVTKHKVDAKIEGWFHTIGFMLLMLLMLYITYRDILRLF